MFPRVLMLDWQRLRWVRAGGTGCSLEVEQPKDTRFTGVGKQGRRVVR